MRLDGSCGSRLRGALDALCSVHQAIGARSPVAIELFSRRAVLLPLEIKDVAFALV